MWLCKISNTKYNRIHFWESTPNIFALYHEFGMKSEFMIYIIRCPNPRFSLKLWSRDGSPPQRIRDNYPKYLLTLDEVNATADHDGIRKMS